MNYEKILNVVLPTLGEDRRKTYSPFFPIDDNTGKILQVPVNEINTDDFTISFTHEGKNYVKSVLDGQCKLQWKVDWAMRWSALNIDYEMNGKDLIPSFELSSQIANFIEKKIPSNMTVSYTHLTLPTTIEV